MNEYQINLKLNGIDDDINDFFSTILKMTKGYGITISESSCKPFQEEVEIKPVIPKQKEEQKEHLTVQEAADYLNISPWTIYSYTYKRTIPFYKMGNKILLKREELDKWLESKKMKSFK